jgi:2-dehydro-3-deoxyphosphogluconate aldolase/(4S)-4-hydroxy-2-oxoglutarate aldolase
MTHTSAEQLLSALRQRRLLAIVRGDDPDAVVRCVDVLVSEGVPLVEISLTGKGSLSAIEQVAREFGDDVYLGAGTVLTADLADRAAAAGARYAVTPALGPGVDRSIELGLPVLAGVLTPTEVAQARLAGAAAAKLFPASTLGAGYLRALRAPFPDVPFLPVGGIGIDEARDFLDAGAIGVGVGTPLLGDAPSGGDLDRLRQRTRELRAAIDEVGR